MKKTKKPTPVEVCPKEWARIEAAITAAFDVSGLSRLYAARALDAVASIIYDCKRSSRTGKKWVSRPCVELPVGWFDTVFGGNKGNAAKCKKILESCGILLADQSWAAPNLQHPGGTWANAYAIDYTPQGPETLTVWFPSASSIIEGAVAALRGIPRYLELDPTGEHRLTLDKAGLLAAARSGAVDARDFASAVSILRKYPTLDKCRNIGGDGDERLYTPLTMVSKSILPSIHDADDSAAVPLYERADLHCSALLSLAFIFAIEERPQALPDGSTALPCDGLFRKVVKDLYGQRWFIGTDGKPRRNSGGDLYNRILAYIVDRERGTNLFHGLTPEGARDKIKAHFMGAIFATQGDVSRWRTLRRNAFEEMRGKRRVSKKQLDEERKARIRLLILDFIKEEYTTLSYFITNYRTSGRPDRRGRTRQHKTPLFHAMTRGEKALMAYLAACFEARGFGDSYRKHDALLTTDPHRMTEQETDRFVESALLAITANRPGYASEGCKRVWETWA